MAKEKLSLRNIIHPATESPGKKYFYLFFLDPRGDVPVTMERIRFLEPGVTPSTIVWKADGCQRLPLFWIHQDDLLKAIGYADWGEEFERKVIRDAWASFPDYEECKAKKIGKVWKE